MKRNNNCRQEQKREQKKMYGLEAGVFKDG